MKKSLLFSASALLITAQALAGSFQLNLQGIRQTALGGSGTGYIWDASTMFFNPGGLSRLKGMQAYASAYALSPSVSYSQYPTTSYQIEAERKVSTPFAAYVGGPVKHNSKLGIGVGIYTPFGSSANWGNDWAGRFMVQNISLQSIFIQPTVSYLICDHLSVGVGIVYGFGNMEINKALPINFQDGSEGSTNLKGNASGWGVNIGVHYKPSERFQFGLNFRSGVKMKVTDGRALFNVPTSVASNFPANLTTGFTTALPLPSILTGGMAVKLSDAFTLQGDLVFAAWSRYKTLDFNFQEQKGAVANTSELRNYRNTLALRVGLTYAPSEKWDIMLGGAIDPTPSQNHLVSPDAVDGNRYIGSGGLVFKPTENIQIMGAVTYTYVGTREASYQPANFNGAYSIRSLCPGLGVSYTF